MKTARQWFDSLGNHGQYAPLPNIDPFEIAAIQREAWKAGVYGAAGFISLTDPETAERIRALADEVEKYIR